MLTRLTARFSELRRHPGYQANPPVVLGTRRGVVVALSAGHSRASEI